MVYQGTDGVSRGELSQTTLPQEPIRLQVPLDLTALERMKMLKEWMCSWIGPNHMFLEPAQWFVEGHDLRFEAERNGNRICSQDSTTYVWAPPPAIGDVAIEQIRYARLKRQTSLHVFVIPKLFYALFRRQLHKTMDIVLFLPPCFEFWPKSMHEPLIISFLFPYLGLTRGQLRTLQNCAMWAGNCKRCGKRRGWTEGIFCANFCWKVGNFQPCQRIGAVFVTL